MGHRLTYINAPEEEYGMELDREEMKRLVIGQQEEEAEKIVDGAQQLGAQSIGSGLGTDGTKSVSRSTMIYSDESTFTKGASTASQRTLVLLGIGLLLGICLLFTFVNMSSKTHEDWIEPNRDAYLNEGKSRSISFQSLSDKDSDTIISIICMICTKTGIDWAPGPDAPPRFEGAQVDSTIEKHIANWALGTLRVSSEASIDGYGSVSMSQLVLARDIPLYFGHEYTGASMMDMLLGQCLNLIQASNADLSDITNQNDQISLIWANGRKYVNVDTTTTSGIDRAYSMGLVTSGVADVIYSPLLYDAASLFSPKNQARLFIMMRHPVETQFARFRQLRSTSARDIPERHDELINMSYQEFAGSDFVDDNWMTRALVHKMYGETLTPQDMETSKEILRRKAIVGLYDDAYVSFMKYARYFNWDQLRSGGYFTDDTKMCIKDSIEVAKSKDEVLGTLNLNDEEAKEGSDAWKTIMERNTYDYELYMYGQHLYKYQTGLS